MRFLVFGCVGEAYRSHVVIPAGADGGGHRAGCATVRESGNMLSHLVAADGTTGIFKIGIETVWNIRPE